MLGSCTLRFVGLILYFDIEYGNWLQEMLMNQRHAALERFQQNEMMHRMGGYGMAPQGMQQYGQYPQPPQPHPGMYPTQPQNYVSASGDVVVDDYGSGWER